MDHISMQLASNRLQYTITGNDPFESRWLRRLQAFIDKFRFNAKRASMVQSRIKALERLEELDAIEEDPDYVFRCA